MKKLIQTTSFAASFAVLNVAGVILLGIGAPLGAQTSTATLTGVVTDPSGAAIPKATVTLESTTQKYVRTATTDFEGRYAIFAIPPAKYQLVIGAPGFQEQQVPEFSLSSGQATTLNIGLPVGATTERVTITEVPPLLETATATVGTAIESKMIAELPLMGRNFTTLQLVLPGVAPLNPPDGNSWYNAGGVGYVQPSFYGQRQRDNNYTIDGVENNEPLFNSIAVYPPPEALGEMKVESGITSGANGHAAGASVNLVTKSGTKEYHGVLWESFRNNALDARGFFVPKLGALRWNQFGFTFGGPLVIPKLIGKDKAWYVFGYYEGIRQLLAANYTARVPTPGQLAGDMTGEPQTYDPFSTTTVAGSPVRLPFANNKIPPSQLNPSIQMIAKAGYSHIPLNLAPGVIGLNNFINPDPAARGGNQGSIRIDHQFGAKHNVFGRYTGVQNYRRQISAPRRYAPWDIPAHNIAINDTIVLRSNLLLTARFGQSFVSLVIEPRVSPDNLGLAERSGTTASFPVPAGLPEYLPGLGIAGYEGVDLGLGGGRGWYGPQHKTNLSGDLNYTRGAHTVSFGGGFIRTSFQTGSYPPTGGSVGFSRNQTSNFVANTGSPLASFLLGVPDSASRTFGSPNADMFGNGYSFYVQEGYRATRALTINLGLRYDFAEPMKDRVGFGTFISETGQYVWDTTNPITGAPANIRRGFVDPARRNFQPRVGIAYQLNSKTVLRSGYSIFFDTFGAQQSQSAQAGRGNWPYAAPENIIGLNTGAPTVVFPGVFSGPPKPSTVPLGFNQATNAWKGTTRTPYVQQWTFSLQRQLKPSLVAEAVYFGSHAVKLVGQIIDNGAIVPGPGPIAERQKWPNVAQYTLDNYNAFPAYYQALSVKLEKRFSKNLSFLASHTWAKNIDYVDSLINYSGRRPSRYNLRQLKGPAGFDLSHRFVASYVYEIPGSSRNKVLDAIIGKWSTSGVFAMDNGFPYTLSLSFDNQNTGQGDQFPNLVGEPTRGHTRTVQQWFNTAAFATPARFTIGNAGRNILRADGFVNFDASLHKVWPIKERSRVEFRAEFFNLPNTVVFAAPGNTVETPNFGRITGARNVPRQVQLALKLHY